LAGELPAESEQFRFLRASRLANLKVSVGLILVKTSTIWVIVPIDLSTWSFIPLPRFLNSRRVSPLLNQSLVLSNSLPKWHMMCVMFNKQLSILVRDTLRVFPHIFSCLYLYNKEVLSNYEVQITSILQEVIEGFRIYHQILLIF
jgi:hypothetical protein